MPPSPKFTKAEIIEAAVRLIREKGTEALTARALGKTLGSSARPIFTVFQTVEEVKGEVLKAAKAKYRHYVEQGLSETPAFYGVGRQYIRFAIEEPQMFRLLFMSKQPQNADMDEILPLIEENYERILESVINGYGLEETSAKKFYRCLWIYSHGVATLFATGMCQFNPLQIAEMMKEVAEGIMMRLKKGDAND